ncbi:coiled-coil domain-containing protein [Mycoplasmopsis gallopavonis]|nr:hypothetical protein [Mycoplasmopsis gallopavonis]
MTSFKNAFNDFRALMKSLETNHLDNFYNLSKIFYDDEFAKFNTDMLTSEAIDKELELFANFSFILKDVIRNYQNYDDQQILAKYQKLEDLYFAKKKDYFQILIQNYLKILNARKKDLNNSFGSNEYYANKINEYLGNFNASYNQDATIDVLKQNLQDLTTHLSSFDEDIQEKHLALEAFKGSFNKITEIANSLKQRFSTFSEEIDSQINLPLADYALDIAKMSSNQILEHKNQVEELLNKINELSAKYEAQEDEKSAKIHELKRLIVETETFITNTKAIQFSDFNELLNTSLNNAKTINEDSDLETIKQTLINLTDNLALATNASREYQELLTNLLDQKTQIKSKLFSKDANLADLANYLNTWNQNFEIKLESLTKAQLKEFEVALNNFFRANNEIIAQIIKKHQTLVINYTNLKSSLNSLISMDNLSENLIRIKEDFLQNYAQINLSQTGNAELEKINTKLESFINEFKTFFKSDLLEMYIANKDFLATNNSNLSNQQLNFFESENNLNQNLSKLKELNNFMKEIISVHSNLDLGSLNEAQFDSLQNQFSEILNSEQLNNFLEYKNELNQKMEEFKNLWDLASEKYQTSNDPEIKENYEQNIQNLDRQSNLSLEKIAENTLKLHFFLSLEEHIVQPEQPKVQAQKSNYLLWVLLPIAVTLPILGIAGYFIFKKFKK